MCNIILHACTWQQKVRIIMCPSTCNTLKGRIYTKAYSLDLVSWVYTAIPFKTTDTKLVKCSLTDQGHEYSIFLVNSLNFCLNFYWWRIFWYTPLTSVSFLSTLPHFSSTISCPQALLKPYINLWSEKITFWIRNNVSLQFPSVIFFLFSNIQATISPFLGSADLQPGIFGN